ncbi:uncharacterized protein LOC126896440 [Daktulosphaira vitifoliae]|uniref:uncharacterized protein LOC126896440 n=1 Tax=Daktulosphaira vitifoliae TaxID=58002 RepID=UPI0021AAF1B0|nr:uncharacterized protein LOC126896440 [Daktulosphaira vitifoliae]
MSIVRVKRRHDEDPFNSVVISHKKLKIVGNCSTYDCVFKFAGTIKDTNENISQILKNARDGKSVKDLTKFKKNEFSKTIISRSKSERSKVVSNLRAVNQDTIPIHALNEENTEIKVVDIIANEEVRPSIDEGISVDYVYDLYYTTDNNEKNIDIQDIDCVHGLDSDKFYSICDNIENDDASSPCEDDDDSNDECNWRNDYPDEDEFENSDEDYENLITRSKHLNINSSSSSELEDEENISGDYDYRYARYKARVKAEENYFYNSVLEDESNESSDYDTS